MSNPETIESDDVARSGPVSTAWLENNMAADQSVLAVLVGLISSLVQLNVAMSTVYLNYVKQRFDILRVLSVSNGRITGHKHLKRAGRQPRLEDSVSDQARRVYGGTILSTGRW